MEIRQFDKWIQGVSPDSSIEEAAKISLRNRFAALLHFLPLAAMQAGDDLEYVHQLRVSTRRTTAALKLFACCLPKRRTRKMRRILRKIRRSAGKARDLDVLIQRYSDADRADVPDKPLHRALLRQLKEHRLRTQNRLKRLFTELEQERILRRKCRAIIRRICCQQSVDSEPGDCFGNWALRKFRSVIDEFIPQWPTNAADLPCLHEFRIRCKHLKYTMELLAGAFPVAFRSEVYDPVAEIQERLGKINDHRVARELLQREASACRRRSLRNYMRGLASDEEQQMQESHRSLQDFWEYNGPEQLQHAVRAMLS